MGRNMNKPRVKAQKVKRDKIKTKIRKRGLEGASKIRHIITKEILTAAPNRTGKAARKQIKEERKALREAYNAGELTEEQVLELKEVAPEIVKKLVKSVEKQAAKEMLMDVE